MENSLLKTTLARVALYWRGPRVATVGDYQELSELQKSLWNLSFAAEELIASAHHYTSISKRRMEKYEPKKQRSQGRSKKAYATWRR